MTGRARTGPATRTALLAAAVAVVVESGWQGAGVREIAGRAGVPVGGIHYHFGGREPLLIEAVMREVAAMFSTPARMIAEAAGPEQLLEGTLGWTASPDVTPAQRMLLMEVMAQARRDPAVAAALDAALAGYRNGVAAALHRVGAPAVAGDGTAERPGATTVALAAALVAQANGLWLQTTVEPGFPAAAAAAEARRVWRSRLLR